jgi:hypothetical protein
MLECDRTPSIQSDAIAQRTNLTSVPQIQEDLFPNLPSELPHELN